MDVHANVPDLRDAWLTGVEPHADAHGRTFGPGIAEDASLRRDRCQQRLARAREDSKHPVPLRVGLLATSFLNGRTDKSPALH